MVAGSLRAAAWARQVHQASVVSRLGYGHVNPMKTQLALATLLLAFVLMPAASAQPPYPGPPPYGLNCYDTTYYGTVAQDVVNCAQHLVNDGHGPQVGWACMGVTYWGPLVDDVAACVVRLENYRGPVVDWECMGTTVYHGPVVDDIIACVHQIAGQ